MPEAPLPADSSSHPSFGAIVATIGAILIALGVAWLIALNWDIMPAALKVMILVFFTIVAYAGGVMFRIFGYPKIGQSLLILGALLYTLSIFLIAQIFHLAASIQGYATLLLIAWVGIFLAAYIFTSKQSISIALIQFFIWVSLQYGALVEGNESAAVGPLALIYLFLGVFVYGLTQLHKSLNHTFTEAYRNWTALYVLLLTYILSFQTFLPVLWPRGFEMPLSTLFFMLLVIFFALVAAVAGISLALSRNKLSGKEVLGFVALLLFYIALISATSLVSGQQIGIFDGGRLSAPLFLFWIFDNILFILVILSVIGYGTRYQSVELVNLAMMFFALDIITRYIGFIMDYGGQLGFAVMSIIGGIILIVGGWLIEKWRRRLIKRTAEKSNEYTIY